MQYYIPYQIIDNKFILSNEDKHHIINVLRMVSGDFVYLIANGSRHKCAINIINDDVELMIVESESLITELPVNITLIYGLPRLEKFELVLQKAVELGVSKIVPYFSEFSIVKLDNDRIETKLTRWRKIIKEASEQSHRANLVELGAPVSLNGIKSYMSEINVVANETKNDFGTSTLRNLLNNQVKSITVLVGPEGGFSKDELIAFERFGFKSVSLGKRILRSETAAIYMFSVLSFFYESLD